MTSFRGLAAYTVPKIDVLVSAQFRSLNPNNIGGVGGGSATNGASLNANYQLPNSVVQQIARPTAGRFADQRHDDGQPASAR